MVSATKPSTAPGPRRKSSKPSLVITLKLSPELLKRFRQEPVKEESPSKESSAATSNELPVAASSNGENHTESTSNTPVASGTPAPVSMPPPTEGVKKKGVKRGPAPALGPDGLPRVRGKPGPKKKPRLEDGSVDHSATTTRGPNGAVAHKLGPKANQGAINAGLRALDRSGKPCRKWQKGSLKLKSFTGVMWEIHRWTAPPKTLAQINTEGSTSDGSSKENKDSSQVESEKSEKDSSADTEMKNGITTASSPPASNAETPQPAPIATAAL